MKLYISLLTIFFLASCSGKPAVKNAPDENKIAKNKEIAIKNEATELTRIAQKLDQQGRGMEMYRQAGNAENMRECNLAMEDAQKQLKDFEERVAKLPDSFRLALTPIAADLYECAACSKKAMDGCRKARASINEAIKKIYP
jgi:hypothetical protein